MKRLLSSLLLLALSASTASALSQSNIPPKFPIPWGASAGSSYIRSIPIPSQIGIQNCAASLTDGFPPLTFVPASAGGCPPFGQDFNGIFKQVSQWSQWQAAGSAVLYDSAFQSAIGGYPKWASLGVAAHPGCFWVSSVDGNATNPDTGGGGWINTCAVGGALTGMLPNPGLAATGVTAGTYTASKVTVGADGRVTAISSCPAVTVQRLLSGTNLTYTPTSGTVRSRVTMVGGGGGGSGGGGSGGNGGTTIFHAWTAIGGNGAASLNGGDGGTGGNDDGVGTLVSRTPGSGGNAATPANTTNGSPGGGGAASVLGGGTTSVYQPTTAPSAPANTGSGGAGGPAPTLGASHGGGGAGEYVQFWWSSGTAPYTIGAGGAAGTAGGGNAGGAGATGIIIVEDFGC